MISLETPRALKPPVPPAALDHRRLRDGDFWRAIPRYAEIDEATFLDHIWQGRHSVKTTASSCSRPSAGSSIRRSSTTRAKASGERADGRARFAIHHRVDRLDAIRRTIRSAASSSRSHPKLLPDHPRLTLDSLHEQEDSPVQRADPPLSSTRRCSCRCRRVPVYCRFCTRSYAIGPDTDAIEKTAAEPRRWTYGRPVVRLHRVAATRSKTSSSPAAMRIQLAPKNITLIGEALARDPAPAPACVSRPKASPSMPMKISHRHGLDRRARRRSSITRTRARQRRRRSTRTSTHPNEISCDHASVRPRLLFERGVYGAQSSGA